MRRLIPVAVAWLLAGGPSAVADVDKAVLQAEARRVAVMAKAKDSVLATFSASGRGGGKSAKSSGARPGLMIRPAVWSAPIGLVA